MNLEKDVCRLELRSIKEYNMSNWQITHTVDTMTMVNNKFDILNKVNNLISSGVKKKNIFITKLENIINNPNLEVELKEVQ